jgi:hypothetical protein
MRLELRLRRKTQCGRPDTGSTRMLQVEYALREREGDGREAAGHAGTRYRSMLGVGGELRLTTSRGGKIEPRRGKSEKKGERTREWDSRSV